MTTLPAPGQICCYLLYSGRRTYIGYTVNLARRLRQHRGELAGGARYTAGWPQVELVACVAGFPDKRRAMSFEWHAKRRRRCAGAGAKRRLPRLYQFLRPLRHCKFADCKAGLEVLLAPAWAADRAALADFYGHAVQHFKLIR